MTRISNETLAKVIVKTVDGLEKTLKNNEKKQLDFQSFIIEKFEELKTIQEDYNKHLIKFIETEENLHNNKLEELQKFTYKVDLKPFQETYEYNLQEFKKASENANKTIRSGFLGLKAIGIYLLTLIFVVLGFYLIYSKQVNKINNLKTEINHLNEDNRLLKETFNTKTSKK